MMFTLFGASGYIGERTVARLRENHIDVFTPARGDASIFTRDLGHVIYAIGLTADFRTRPFDTVRAHITFLAEVIEKCKFKTFTYLSSTRVYSGSTEAHPDSGLVTNPMDPSDLYNLTKLTGESLCLSVARGKAKVVRLSNVVGKGGVRSENFVDTLVRDAIHGRLVVRSAPESAKDYIHIDDVAEMLPRIAVEGRRDIYNLASGVQVTHRQWTDEIKSLLPCEVVYQQGAALHQFPAIDITQLAREFYLSPRPVLPILPELIASHQSRS